MLRSLKNLACKYQDFGTGILARYWVELHLVWGLRGYQWLQQKSEVTQTTQPSAPRMETRFTSYFYITYHSGGPPPEAAGRSQLGRCRAWWQAMLRISPREPCHIFGLEWSKYWVREQPATSHTTAPWPCSHMEHTSIREVLGCMPPPRGKITQGGP